MEKRALQKVHTIDFSVSLAVLNFVFSIPFLFLINYLQLSGLVLLLIFVTALLSTIAFFLVAKGIRHMELSTISPLLSLSPGVTSVLAFFVIGEYLKIQSIVGIILLVVGSYILTLEQNKNLFEPFRVFFRTKYLHLVLLSLLFYSLASIFDRVILHQFIIAIPAYMFFVQFFITLLLIPFGDIFGGGARGVVKAFRLGGKDLFFTSLFVITSRFFEMLSIQLAPIGLVSAVKRSSSFFTTVIGGEIFHEHNLKRKIVSSIIIVVGSMFIAFS
jgi:drug/metabolite transporter (DMT)-like permease